MKFQCHKPPNERAFLKMGPFLSSTFICSTFCEYWRAFCDFMSFRFTKSRAKLIVELKSISKPRARPAKVTFKPEIAVTFFCVIDSCDSLDFTLAQLLHGLRVFGFQKSALQVYAFVLLSHWFHPLVCSRPAGTAVFHLFRPLFLFKFFLFVFEVFYKSSFVHKFFSVWLRENVKWVLVPRTSLHSFPSSTEKLVHNSLL